MGQVRCFRDDDLLKPKLDALENRELSKLIRGLLYSHFFGDQIPRQIVYYPQTSSLAIPKIEVDNTPVEDFKTDMFD
jgi:hypothetical protein